MDDLFNEILQAASQGDGVMVHRLRDGLNRHSEDGGTVLMHAIISGDIQAVSTLLSAGADPNLEAIGDASDYLASTPLSLALQARHLMDYDRYNPIVDCLIRAGAEDD